VYSCSQVANPGQPGVSTASRSRTEAQTTSNQGKLLLDATCAPADISYPTDLSLLNEAREKYPMSGPSSVARYALTWSLVRRWPSVW
jgi:hypothetical protein